VPVRIWPTLTEFGWNWPIEKQFVRGLFGSASGFVRENGLFTEEVPNKGAILNDAGKPYP